MATTSSFAHGVHLVGSVPLANAETVFRTAAAEIGDRLRGIPDGGLTGASCWRADGTPVGLGGGYARQGVRFWPEARREAGDIGHNGPAT